MVDHLVLGRFLVGTKPNWNNEFIYGDEEEWEDDSNS